MIILPELGKMKFPYEKLGFTRSEIRILLLAIIVLTIGFGLKFYDTIFTQIEKPEFDFTESDREFTRLSNSEPDINSYIKLDTININEANLEELMSLDGIGESLALEIITYRKNNGGFKKPEDIMKVAGIGPKKFEKFKNKIKVK